MQCILHYYYYTINPSVHNTQLSKYAMTVAHEASAAREPIGYFINSNTDLINFC